MSSIVLHKHHPKILICGTTFGQFYLEAIQVAGFSFELVGILAHGSERSIACAKKYNVPLFTDINQLPDVDIACVVIRAGILGGKGTELAKALMNRGIHVIQEHPLHADELADCLRVAKLNNVNYRVNFFYKYLEPVKKFIGLVQTLLKEQRPLYIDAMCSFQVTYGLFDILAQALGSLRPWAFTKLPPFPIEFLSNTEFGTPFRSIDGVIGGVPVTLRIQNQMNPSDPDNFAHLLHRITIGTEGGNLTLFNTHGPIIWSPRLYVPIKNTFGVSFDELAITEHLKFPSTDSLDDSFTSSNWHEILTSIWPAGLRMALIEFYNSIQKGEDALQQGQYHLAICRIVQEISANLGKPELIFGDPPHVLSLESLMNLMIDMGKSDKTER